jgi:hypothetical protein
MTSMNGPERPGNLTTYLRILLVHVAGGALIGAGCGSFFTVIGLVVGAMIGFSLGLVCGLLAVALIACVVRRRPNPTSRAVRRLFLVPAALSLAFPLALWTIEAQAVLDGRSTFEVERTVLVVLLLPVPLAPLLITAATAWCLERAIPALRRPRAARRMLYGGLPALLLVLAGGTLSLYFTP